MDYGSAADALIQHKILQDIYSRMSDDERRLFAQMSMGSRSDSEILSALRQQQAQLQDLRKHQQTFGEDFISNIAGNAAWEGAVWILSRLSRLVR